ncbi:MAG: carbon monoxide dehydrogenase subunit G [Armatimonadetes bacterium]|nr:carbon monoxide dehydrogenase subunit G [Anaerolineae bacterium]
MMDISGDYLFDAPQRLVWDALQDPNVLGTIIPGGKGIELIGDNQYSTVLEVKVGPVQGTFQGKIALSDIVTPERYQIDVDGKGAPGFVKASGKIQLEARNHQTLMTYVGQAQIGGRIASVGQRLMDSAARSIIRQSLDALNAYLIAQVAQQAPPVITTANAEVVTVPLASVAVPVSSYQPPSQMALALNVARDVLNDYIPPKYQFLALGAGVAVIVLIIVLIAN